MTETDEAETNGLPSAILPELTGTVRLTRQAPEPERYRRRESLKEGSACRWSKCPLNGVSGVRSRFEPEAHSLERLLDLGPISSKKFRSWGTWLDPLGRPGRTYRVP
jgi:hypothetical protein